MTNKKKSSIVLHDAYNRPISEKITYPIKLVQVVHITFLNEYYKGANKSLAYLEREIKKMEKDDNVCMGNYDIAISTLNEMRKALIAGIFHLWLHNLQEYFTMGGDEFHPNKKIFTTIGFDSIMKVFKNISDKNLIKTIKKYSLLTNAIKHGIGKSLVTLRTNYSEFFYPSEEYTTKCDEGYISEYAREPLVTKKHFEELYFSLIKFWENIPDRLVIDIQEFVKERSND